MHHAPTTLEDQLILKAIKEECPWENLPKRLQATLNSTEEWHRRIIDHCLKRRLQWNSCFARKVCKEGEYYEEMMRYLRRNLALFPYHLAEYICRVMRVSPFRYYCDMLFEVMKNEQPYDSIPNFSAADALRLAGIGRNEFIDIMNKCRSKKIMWKLNKSIAKELLPTQPVDFVIEPWWGVCLVNFTLEEFKKLTEEEMATIDKICKEEVNSFLLFDPEVVKGLFRRGLVYFDVPVYPDDRFKVSRLEGFVSNREQSYEDPIEELLYAVFVVLSENSTVAELAATLQADLSQLQAASSFACRLGWAIKLLDPGSILQDTSTVGSPKSSINDEEDGSRASLSSANMPTDGSGFMHGDIPWTENQCATSGYTRVAFLVDANITSYLMMGSVSPGLKSHAVTLYEAGKLGHDSIADLCKDLSTLEGAKFEGELQEFANHAFSLRCVLECLTSGGVKTDDGVKDGIPSCINPEATSLVAGTPSTIRSGDFGTCVSELTADDYASTGSPKETPDAYQSTAGSVAGDNPLETTTDENDNFAGDSRSELTSQLEEKMVTNESVDVGKGTMTQRRYRVDVLRCESLAALSPATLDRLFLHDYDIVVSMVPLPTSAVLPGPKGPLHFGPPSYSSMTPWMKLSLYSTMGSGPLSVVLMKGQCLRTLPAPLAGCEKALVWSWDGSSIGGLGGKSEGNLVKGSVLLHCLNSLIKYSAVLVQPLSRYDLDEGGRIVTLEIPLPLMNSDGSTANIGEEMGLHPDVIFNLNSLLTDLANTLNIWSIGYIRLIRLFKANVAESFAQNAQYEWVPVSVEFGIPLFSPKLCSYICKRVVSSQLLQMDLFTEHHDAMQELRKSLRNVCDEYRTTGPAARLLYQKEQSKEQSSRKLMTYASGRWNPLVDPSSPISGTTSEHQRLKLACRSRCRTEVLSFDGKILRSYALTPVYEAGVIEDSSSTSTVKMESDDAESKEVIHPGVNLLFDGFELCPFDIGACLQARQPAFLIAEASAASVNSAVQ
ncbi:PREDICTED: protein FAM91A1-like isoform X1 [Ipomoea nil]|uniref:protein FAM91A1-like isoform X1 n=2 Tax=Ipomoea nil TaxID=35883 RepID=UPI0009014BE9|nr:PREDICTED: protein FAM91A1-like isoform X1 [Ipomoea nil]XP_019190444.1 PREDICTED: protein FAM91A1-like isoform X1 [Ipomoea nil]XP_019190445.1 PREDICTED: protein FAM91A1-like isoform X1 [Ipomoea nil]XP_019190446.1 PREDICTED: protein FAM91A1-like isoform X1 [Ipomoea nil]